MADAAVQNHSNPLEEFITDELVEHFPDVIQMLIETTSLNLEEKKYWLQLLPLMSSDHVDKLRKILTDDLEKARSLDGAYDKVVLEMDDATKVTMEEQQQQRKEVLAKEEQEREGDLAASEELLKGL